jgi:HEAT repeat protein
MAQRRTWAILIGIDKYRHLSRLKNSVADARLIRQILVTEFSVDPRMCTLITDRRATRKALLRLITITIPERWEVRPSDQLVVFFAGHADVALKNRRRTWYVAPADATLDSQKAPDWDSVITGADIRHLEETFRGAHILNILDACYSGMQFAAEVPKDRKVRVKSAYAIVAGRGGDPVLDEGGEGHEDHSIFTESLVTALKGWGRFEVGEEGSFTASDLDTFIRKDVPRQIRKRRLRPLQKPFGFALQGNAQGDQFTFFPTAPRLPHNIVQSLLIDRVDIKRTAVAGLSALLSTTPLDLVLDALDRLSKDDSPAVRAEVAAQLASVTGSASTRMLLNLLRDSDEDERVLTAAARALSKTSGADRTSVVKALNSARVRANFRLRRTIDFSLAQLGDLRSVRAIVRDLPTEQGSIRREIILVLRHLPGSAMSRAELTDLLEALLRSAEWRKRRAASEALGELGLEGAVHTLAKLATTSSEHFMVRCAAAEALGHIGRGPASDAVREALRVDSSLMVRTAAAESLGTLGGVDAVDHLTAALSRDDEWRVRRAAAEACGFLQDSRAVPTLQHAADDSHFRVRMAVAWALGEIGTDEAHDTLTALSQSDRSSLVRRSALRARVRLTA